MKNICFVFIIIYSADNDEVKLRVENPGGAQNLTVTFTIISERPIERNNVVNVPPIYQVAEVCL